MKKKVIFAILVLSCGLITACGKKNEEVLPTEQVETEVTEVETEEFIPVETETEEEINPVDAFFEQYWELDTPSVRQYLEENPEIAGDYSEIAIDNMSGELELLTVNDDKILDLDQKNNVVLIEIHGSTYVAKLVLVKEPAQLELKRSRGTNKGDRIAEFAAIYNPILAVNASGFADKGGAGSGGQVAGCMIVDGVDYGKSFHKQRKFYGLNNDNVFVIEDYWNVKAEDYRWGFQFHPQLVVNGVYANNEGYGGSNQPRTVGGQAKDGTFLI